MEPKDVKTLGLNIDADAGKPYLYEPQPDITTYELSRCVIYLSRRMSHGLENEPESVRRHWREVVN